MGLEDRDVYPAELLDEELNGYYDNLIKRTYSYIVRVLSNSCLQSSESRNLSFGPGYYGWQLDRESGIKPSKQEEKGGFKEIIATIKFVVDKNLK